ncbi:MAG: acyl-CoA dehydrogenase family protein, partial [Acidimicrobiales bacterium]
MGGWPGRDELTAWRRELEGDWYADTPYLAHVLARRAGARRAASMAPRLAAFGRTVAQVVEPAVAEMERHRDLPASVPYDGVGNPVAGVSFHPAHRVAGRAVWASGLPAMALGGGGFFEPAALFYLLSHVGEGGQACPLVCTVGLARALARRGPDELRRRYLERLVSTDYDGAWRGSQFLTEVQGGSDVGANATVAEPEPDRPGAWRIRGEKWFCSVADAELFAVTARPEGAPGGTGGLGCFLVPRWSDTTPPTPNGFRIRRLKDKLGTRALASAEIEFDGALAWPIGRVEEGFHTAVDDLLNTSRWMNALGSTGIMRRAVLEAGAFVRRRQAFGAPV